MQVRDVRAAVAAGAAGVVVGALDLRRDRGPSRRLRRLVEAADGREVTFHRALDTVPALAPAVDDAASARRHRAS